MTMDMERQRRLPNDHMSGNWSFGSIYHQSSQSRKISIGVMVDSSAKMKSQNEKGVVAELRPSQNVKSAKDIPAESKHNGKGTVSPDLGTQNKPPCPESSLLVDTKNSHHNMPYSEAIGNQKTVSSLYSTSNVSLQPSGSKIAGEKEPGSYFANQMLNLHAINANEKKSKTDTYQRERESSYTTPQKVVEPKKGIPEQGTSERGNSGPVTLRMKVQELLETVYSPDKKQDNPETSEINVNDLKPKSTTNENGSSVARHRQDLQTKETNSGSLDHRMRPLTRSLTRKKPQAQKPAPKKLTPLCRSKQAQLDENAFSFVETWSKIPNTDNQGSKTFKRKETEILGTRPVKICVVEGVHKDETQQATDGRKTKASAKSVSLSENRTRDSDVVKPNAEMKEKTSHPFEVLSTQHQPGGNNGNNVDQEPFAKHSSKKNLDPQYDLKGPAFKLKTAAKISSPISSFQINQEDIDVDSLSERSFKIKRTRSSHSKGSLKGGHYNASTKSLSMDLQDSPVIKPDSEVNKCFSSPSKVVQSESSEDASPITAPIISEGNKWSVSPCQEEDSESSEDGSFNKGDGDCGKLDDSSEQDGFAGAVKLFALALERVQSKIHSTTRRQSAAILLSVSNNIHSQLQNAEYKIQNEVEKLTHLGKSKRMHPENQYQEQQEQLKSIYENFKEDVDQHLEKCRSTLEGLKAHQVQVRGMVEKQRLSHKKFILQTEEAIEKQLNDAQRRVADVHRMAKEKMAKLKYGIAECLKEGLLS